MTYKSDRMSEQELLTQISDRFDELYRRYGDGPIRTQKEIDENPRILHDDFHRYGYAVIDDALNDAAFKQNQQSIIQELSLHLFNVPNPFENLTFKEEYGRIEKKYPNLTDEEKILATLTCWWNSSNGFGNSSFRFLYLQFLANNPLIQIGETDIEFSRNPWHRHSLRLLYNHPKLWNILKSFHPEASQPMVSWDSQKVRFQDTGRPLSKINKSTQPTLTVPHRDIYLNDGILIDRVQAMLISQSPNAISLGWVLFSHDSVIQKLSSMLLNKKPDGFSTVTHQGLIDIMNKYWRAPLRGFVLWKQETVHYEGEPDVNRKLKEFKQTPQNLPLFSFRVAIGSHVPINLSQTERIQLAYLAEAGWCPEIYLKNKPHNKGTNVNYNVVNRKSTQYMVPRQLTPSEEQSLKSVTEDYSTGSYATYIAGLPGLMKEFYGVY